MSMHELASLMPYRADFPDAFAALEEAQRDAQTRRARLTLANTPLSIGIIGQIKAGKSSFLNQLLFGGQPLLPEAATPKTANLTRIRHADKPRFTAHFYSPQSWAALERLADSPASDQAAKTARELVEQARRTHGAQIAQLLAQGEATLAAEDIAGLLGRIGDFVAAEGRFTPLVESSELALPLPELEGIEIVDTPGMNDPVVSRTDKTRRYMAQCDVVFFLSQASKLLDENDQQLLATQLPAKGVKRLILVAAQFDAAILDDGFNRPSLEACETRLRQRLGEHAQRNLERLAAQRERQGFGEVAALLRGIGAPLFASTYAQALAVLPPEQWNAGQHHLHRQFAELAQDRWNGQGPSQADWLRIGGFDAINAALAQARADKETILAEQRAKLEKELAGQWLRLLDNLRALASERLRTLQTQELADLDAEDAALRQQIERISTVLVRYLHSQADQARRKTQSLHEELDALSQRASRLEERTGTRRHAYKVKVSDSVWYKPWTWFSYHYETYYETESYQYLMLSDALENLRFYFAGLKTQLLEPFNALISSAALSAGLRRELLAVLDLEKRGDGLDARTLRAMIETALDRIEWPRFELAAPVPADVFSGFSTEVTDYSQRQALRQRLEETVVQLQRQVMQALEDGVRRACDQLDQVANQLTDALTASLDADRQRLRAAMADKKQQIARMQALLAEIDRCA